MHHPCKESRLLRHRGKKRRFSLPAHRAYERKVTASNQLWEMDIQHKRIADHTMVQILSIIDVFDRVTVFSQGYLSCKSRDVVKSIQEDLKKCVGKGEGNPMIRTDNGSQFVSHEFHKFMETIGIYHERIPNKSPNHNAHIESYHSIVRSNFLDRFEFRNFKEFCRERIAFIKHYNGEYCHGSLGYLAPHEYRKTMRNSKTGDPTKIVKVI
ncbi:DDE-type integrase/transposase/recombinase [Pasteuria penetrans]|uniref:DDE-type integrase/transposase/recombinase n=1 Tax=Pasteuria penetrans TaxID=86005 RepID=UPI000F903634